MALSDSQVRQLKAKLDPRYIKTRNANGANLSYVEGWHAIAEANRIFGFDAWDRRTVSTTCVWSGQSGQVSRSSLHRQGAGQRARRRYHDCAGGLRNGGRQSLNPGASSRACS